MIANNRLSPLEFNISIQITSGCIGLKYVYYSFFRAPDGCFQYFFENVNTIMTFNYDGAIARANTDGGVLANLDYRICIKKNAGKYRRSSF